MLYSSLILSALASTALAGRGLLYQPNTAYPNDYQKFINKNLGIYYTYEAENKPELTNAGMEFVPMLWGDKNGKCESWPSQIAALGSSVKYALAFNEPDQPAIYGGSAMGVSDAVSLFKQYMTPLAAKGIKLGTPACSNGDSGTQWLQQFMAACSDCNIGFIVTHYYGNAAGLKAHMENLHSLFPSYDLWLTEWADAHDTLASTQTETAAMHEFLDSASYIPHSFYFGAVRASTLNIGANAALLSDNGDLTPLGSSYVSGGGSAPPASSYAAPSYTKPASTSVYVAPVSVYVAPTATQNYVVATPYSVTHTTLRISTKNGVAPKKTSTKCTSTTKSAKKSKHRHHTRTTVAPAAYKTVVVSEVVTKTMTHYIYDKY